MAFRPLGFRKYGFLTGTANVAFTPAALFAAGEPGAWYDPSDLSTMFQDTAGTAPVTATGQTVGLLLDKSKGLVLGPELVTNGDFSSGTDWTLSGSASIGAGELSLPAGSDARQTISIVAGRSYEVTIVRGGAAILVVLLGTLGSGGLSSFQINTAGTYRFILNAAGSNPGLLRINNVSGAATGTVDNISVKELPGNHATQATAASRPIYGIEPFGGRRNLLTYTEQFDNAAWTRQNINPFGSGSVANTTATTDPVGGNTADFIQESTANSIHWVEQSFTTAALTYAFSCYMKAATRNWGYLRIRLSGGADRAAFFNLLNGTIGTVQSGISAAITSVGNGWYRCEISTTTPIVGSNVLVIGVTTADNTTVYTGDGTSGIYLWGAQLETGSTATAYQRVTDQWNVTQAGVPSVSYIQCDGTDDFLLTGTITPGIDKAQVFAGVRKLSDAARGMVLETGLGNQSGSIALQAPSSNGAANYGPLAGGTTIVGVNPTTFTAPITNVVSFAADIPADSLVARINGSQVAQIANDQGTGNFLGYPLYIGRRGGIGLPFNGRIYQMIVRFGANLSAATITQTENYTAGKTGIYTVEQLIRLNTLNASGVSYNAYAAADSNGNNYPVTNTVLAADGTPYSVL